jgi:hypothetical protein
MRGPIREKSIWPASMVRPFSWLANCSR